MIKMLITMKNNLNIRAFPPELNKAAKIESIKRGISLRQLIIDLVTAAIKKEGANGNHSNTQ